MYFQNCKTAEELKAEYKRLAKILHPDNNNGNRADFQEMKANFEKRIGLNMVAMASI